MRAGGCPVAHSDKWGGSWMPSRYEDIVEIARDPQRFSTRAIEVAGPIPQGDGGFFSPPLTSGPADHKAHRDLLAPYFTPARVAAFEGFVREEATRCAERIRAAGGGDAVTEFARPIALGVLSRLLAVPADMQDRFLDWAIRVIRLGGMDQPLRSAAFGDAFEDLGRLLKERSEQPGDALVSHIAQAQIDGQPLSNRHKLGTLLFVALAGADTTWSSLGGSIWHLAQHPEDRRRLIAEPELFRTTAIEELLRMFAPVTMARITSEPVELQGRSVGQGERVLMPYPAANRDPAVFEDPDTVKLDRKRNRHLAFGTGAHTCLGAPLARLEMRVGLQELLRVMPDFELMDATTDWTRGQVRGPERVMIRPLS
ncbi:MAG TPA: cytochrome P450 [Ramlibacter sp.]|nr:cytochrome P450 [Ramlibacter sp.]